MNRAELDVVSLTADLPNEALTKGMIGTIVIIFETPTLSYLIEFCDEKRKTIAMQVLL
ncbi:DUF4926 domain-containing protein [Pseudescherichia vulneris]